MGPMEGKGLMNDGAVLLIFGGLALTFGSLAGRLNRTFLPESRPALYIHNLQLAPMQKH